MYFVWSSFTASLRSAVPMLGSRNCLRSGETQSLAVLAVSLKGSNERMIRSAAARLPTRSRSANREVLMRVPYPQKCSGTFRLEKTRAAAKLPPCLTTADTFP